HRDRRAAPARRGGRSGRSRRIGPGAGAWPAGPSGAARAGPGRAGPGARRGRPVVSWPSHRRRDGTILGRGVRGDDARNSFLSWLALEKRASPLTVEAYGTDLASFLGFLTRHLGGEPDLTALAAVSQADIRAWLASLANEGLVNASRARHLSA